MACRVLAALLLGLAVTAGADDVVGLHAEQDSLLGEPQEVGADDLRLLGSSNSYDKLTTQDRKAIKKVYNEAGQKQHERDIERLRRLEQQPEKHRCWCSLSKHFSLKSKAELEEEKEEQTLDAMQLKVTKAKKEADDINQILKTQVHKRQHEGDSSEASSVGSSCWECQQKKTQMQLQLETLQMEATQLAQQVRSMRLK